MGGMKTRPLHDHYNYLLKLRSQPGCINRTSVEKCPGYKESPPYTAFLKQLELDHACSGFCYQAGASYNALVESSSETAGDSSDFVGFLQHAAAQIEYAGGENE